ncbi:MBL fold metallo-hydrolase [Glycomyces halotolerans]
MGDRWIEVADGVWVRRCEELDLSMGLIVGDDGCLVVDTGVDADHGYDFARAIRELTDLPWQVAYTHDHYDHWFGTASFGESAVWAASDGAAYLGSGDRQRRRMASQYRLEGREGAAERIGRSPLVPPNRRVKGAVGLDLGGRTAVLRESGPAHTGADLEVEVPDAGVLFAGDLLENGAPPQFDDAFPYHWPRAVEYLLSRRPPTVVPGHGEPGDYWWARSQARDLAEVASLCGEVAHGVVTAEEAAEHAPFGPRTMRTALERARTAAPPPGPSPAPVNGGTVRETVYFYDGTGYVGDLEIE